MTDGLQIWTCKDIQISAMAPIWVEKKEGGKKGRMQERRWKERKNARKKKVKDIQMPI